MIANIISKAAASAAMKVFVFDLLPYGEHLDHLKVANELPFPLEKKHFKPAVAAQTYAEHLAAWEEMDRLGYDGIGFNEHHTSPYGLMNSPNLLAAAAAMRTKSLKLLIYGNLLPLHEPLRMAEELSMLDCMSNGRLISGFARGIPREYNVYGVKQSESRARYEEAFEIILKAWTEEAFSYQGKFWSYKDVAMWPRPLQQPHPPVWIPITTSKESIDFAAKHGVPITPGLGARGLTEDIVRYYANGDAPARPQGDAATSLHRRRRLCRRQQGAGGEGNGALPSLFPPHPVQPRQHHRDVGRQDHRLCHRRVDGLCPAREPEIRRALARGFPRHDDGRCRTLRRGTALGHRRRSARPHHRSGRACRR